MTTTSALPVAPRTGPTSSPAPISWAPSENWYVLHLMLYKDFRFCPTRIKQVEHMYSSTTLNGQLLSSFLYHRVHISTVKCVIGADASSVVQGMAMMAPGLPSTCGSEPQSRLSGSSSLPPAKAPGSSYLGDVHPTQLAPLPP